MIFSRAGKQIETETETETENATNSVNWKPADCNRLSDKMKIDGGEVMK